MKKILFAAVLILSALSGLAQVRITSLSPTGRLSWTNPVSSGSYPPIYKVMWSSNINGGLPGFLRVTNQSHALLTNYPSTSQARLYYRVLWENGQEWNMSFYSEFSLVATGKVYIPTQDFLSADVGRFEMRNPGGPGGPNLFNILSRGRLVYRPGLPPENNVSLGFRPDPPATIFDDDLWLEGSIPTTDVWTGNWYESGIAGILAQGEFIAERVSRGR